MNVSRRSGYLIGLDTETSQLNHKLAIINISICISFQNYDAIKIVVKG